jgi:AcrR family transcriptional regulator
MRAARQLFVERGFPKIRMDDVASRSWPSTGAVYSHVGSKRQPLNALVEPAHQAMFPLLKDPTRDFRAIGPVALAMMLKSLIDGLAGRAVDGVRPGVASMSTDGVRLVLRELVGRWQRRFE